MQTCYAKKMYYGFKISKRLVICSKQSEQASLLHLYSSILCLKLEFSYFLFLFFDYMETLELRFIVVAIMVVVT